MNALFRDLRIAGRKLRRTPLFAIVTAVTVGVGLAAVATAFSVVNYLFLQPLPGIGEQERLVNVHRVEARGDFGGFSYPMYRDVAAGAAGLMEVAAFTDHGFSLRAGGAAQLVVGQIVTGNYFRVLDVEPELGRLFEPGERGAGSEPVAVIGHGIWQREFGADPTAVGRVIWLNGHPFTVIGVAPPGFSGTFRGFPFSVWVPIGQSGRIAPEVSLAARDRYWLEAVGRLEDRVSREEARAAMDVLARRLAPRYPQALSNGSLSINPTTGLEDSLRGGIIGLVGVVAGLAILLLLIAASNVAGMLLVRGAARTREFAVRSALGSSRRTIVRQVVIETLVLFLPGAALASLLAAWLAAALRSFNPPLPVPLELNFAPDAGVFVFAFGLAFGLALAVGLVPALSLTRRDLVPALKSGDARSGSEGSGLRRAFVVGQVAMSTVLLLTTALLARSLHRAGAVDPGFRAEGLHLADITLSILDYSEDEGRAFYRELMRRVNARPGVERATITARVPLGLGRSTTRVAVPEEVARDVEGTTVDFTIVGPDYFRTLEVPLVTGRTFLPADRGDASAVAIVNETLAQRLWPGGDALGQRIVRDGVELEVIGVAGDGKYRRPWERPRPYLYIPFAQEYRSRMDLVVRARSGSEDDVAEAIRQEVRALEPDLPVAAVVPVSEYIGISVLPQRIAGTVAGVLGIVALLLAAVGLYAVVAFDSVQRRREIGVRVALGASGQRVIRLVIGQGLRLGVAGVLLGVVLGALAVRALSGLVVGVSLTDPFSFLAVPTLLLLTAVAASLAPGWRAMRSDPMAALRQE
ncbi:MAG: ABC transporter permease [Gemmatimonadetes bacterium]|uniref:ABC transporter permease n=1 Tax=Candidatus Kutchimonas denitrificans TaxID=3056748 RepID=A0AAE5C9E7_9BACT|nr:ABC transporter permease [Gemmatimonadota bacterium]NIR75406.1 ABC transporter permease [Candidatus Kutchimonas denitrificans]NIS01720.1 ABC transporter permease [Gemmatimonadota bacterium]NIT67502.1 ABC transporter permease [Gemmatimonadota bacterium]NIU53365.1 FtsX-like permease family protein [Gemmatimonadota bacterium]